MLSWCAACLDENSAVAQPVLVGQQTVPDDGSQSTDNESQENTAGESSNSGSQTDPAVPDENQTSP